MKGHELSAYAYTQARCPESTGFQAECAEIPGLIAYGETAEEALEEIKIAVCGWLEVLGEGGLPFPEPQQEKLVRQAGHMPIRLNPDDCPDASGVSGLPSST